MKRIFRSLSSLSRSRWHDVAYWGLMLLACAVFMVMNVLTPFKEDDMGFTLIDGVWTPIHSLGDAWQSYCNHLADTNRRLADAIPTLFAGLLGKGLFNVCNMLVFGLMAHLTSLLCAHRRSVTVLALLLAAVGTCLPFPGETMLWMAGSANYLWAVTLSLLLVYYLQRRQGTSSLSVTEGVLLWLGAAVAGGFNEATSFGMFGGMVLYYAFNRRLLDRRAVVALAGYLMGLLLIVSSPSAWNRAAEGGINLNLSWDQLLATRWNILAEKAWLFRLPIGVLLVGIVALAMKRWRAVEQNVWTYVFLGLTLVMFALGILHERAYFSWAVVAFIIVAIGIDKILPRDGLLRAAVIAIAVALAVFTFGRNIKIMKEYKAFNDQVVEQIEEAQQQAILPEQYFMGYSRFIKPANYQSNNFFAHEIIYRAYFGKQNVQFVSDSVYKRFNEGRLLDGARILTPESDHPELVGQLYSFDEQGYLALQLKGHWLPSTFQTARAYTTMLDYEFIDRRGAEQREKYGINLDYVPIGFYPIEYQGQCYFICTQLATPIHKIVFPLPFTADTEEITIENF